MSSRHRTQSPPKGPANPYSGAVSRINLDTQCAVLESSTTPCPQPINCPLHTLDARKAVTGRTRPFETLLSAKLLEEGGVPEPEQAIHTSSKANDGDSLLQPSEDLPDISATIAAINLMAISNSQDAPHIEKALIALSGAVQDVEKDIQGVTNPWNDPNMSDEARTSVLRVRIEFIRLLVDLLERGVGGWSEWLDYVDALGISFRARSYDL